MAYKIRYGRENESAKPEDSGPIRWMAAAGLAAGVVFLRLLGAFAENGAGAVLDAPPETTTELAVSALAKALAAGEGWYHALVVWAGTILHAGAL